MISVQLPMDYVYQLTKLVLRSTYYLLPPNLFVAHPPKKRIDIHSVLAECASTPGCALAAHCHSARSTIGARSGADAACK